MAKEYIQVYPDNVELKTEERKKLYEDFIEHISFGEHGRRFAQALKKLCFEGKVESLERYVRNDDGVLHRVNSLGTCVHGYVCLASPIVDLDFFVSKLTHNGVGDIAHELTVYFDGNPNLSDYLLERVRCLLKAAEMVEPAVISSDRCESMFTSFLSRVCWDADSSRSFITDYWDKLEEVIASHHTEYTDNLAISLFGSTPETLDAYNDKNFIWLCEKYFSRQLGPNMLAYLDSIYESIPSERRIKMENGVIIYAPTSPLE